MQTDAKEKMKIAMLVSGGVDSSVSLKLLKDAGHDIRAFYIKIWLEDELSSAEECPWEEDVEYARALCEKVGVPLEIVPLQREYNERIIRYSLAETRAGRTPNPDMLCNPEIKFGVFYDFFGKNFDKIATGHYAQVEMHDGTAYLKRSKDSVKDQSYFLSRLSQEQLSRALFPIGHLEKKEVRALAEKFGLPTAKRKDSQGLCFLGKIPFDEFLKKHLGVKEGDFVEYGTEKKLGRHNGFWFYTIGQRHGIGLSGGPWYVVKKDTEKNIVYISRDPKEGDEALRNNFILENVHWIADVPRGDKKLSVKIRHGEHEYPCALSSRQDGHLKVTLDGTDRGIAPGQFAVLYDGEYCLGGGTIG